MTFKDGMNIEPLSGKIDIESSGTVRKLLIRSTSVHDEGEYTCVLGDQSCSADVSVIGIVKLYTFLIETIIIY